MKMLPVFIQACCSQAAISSSEGILPEQTTFSLTTRPGVDRIGYFMISPISVTFSNTASICRSSTTLCAKASSLRQFVQPLPRTLM